MRVKYNTANLSDGTIFNYTGFPLNTWAKQIQLNLNGVNVSIAHSFNQKMSYLLKLLMGSINKGKDLAGITLGYWDTLGKFEHLGTGTDTTDTNGLANTELKNKQLKFIVNSEVHIMDEIIFPLEINTFYQQTN